MWLIELLEGVNLLCPVDDFDEDFNFFSFGPLRLQSLLTVLKLGLQLGQHQLLSFNKSNLGFELLVQRVTASYLLLNNPINDF